MFTVASMGSYMESAIFEVTLQIVYGTGSIRINGKLLISIRYLFQLRPCLFLDREDSICNI